MATAYEPRQVKCGDMQNWKFCRVEGSRVDVIGYCASDCAYGHLKPEEASAHYRQYLVERASYTGRWIYGTVPCEICGAYSDRYVEVTEHGLVWTLCLRHCNREGAAVLLKRWNL